MVQAHVRRIHWFTFFSHHTTKETGQTKSKEKFEFRGKHMFYITEVSPSVGKRCFSSRSELNTITIRETVSCSYSRNQELEGHGYLGSLWHHSHTLMIINRHEWYFMMLEYIKLKRETSRNIVPRTPQTRTKTNPRIQTDLATNVCTERMNYSSQIWRNGTGSFPSSSSQQAYTQMQDGHP